MLTAPHNSEKLYHLSMFSPCHLRILVYTGKILKKPPKDEYKRLSFQCCQSNLSLLCNDSSGTSPPWYISLRIQAVAWSWNNRKSSLSKTKLEIFFYSSINSNNNCSVVLNNTLTFGINAFRKTGCTSDWWKDKKRGLVCFHF